jgi:D-aminopeptidase
MTGRPRARDLGIVVGTLPSGEANAITDVAGIRVGHRTLIEGDGPLVVGRGPIRTGVTVIVPGDIWAAPVFAGHHVLNGNGEMTGLAWVRESGLLTGPVAITNTASVGTVRDALVAAEVSRRPAAADLWSLPVVAETYDGTLNDINGFHVRPAHVVDALASATGGAVEEGCVGGGTGMICHGFKGGIGTSSRVVDVGSSPATVGVLVQANHGSRERLCIDWVPVGRYLPTDEIPSPRPTSVGREGGGSIIGVVATDAPLLPHQCDRLARRVGLGVGRVGGVAADSSGDIFLAFSTGNDLAGGDEGASTARTVRMLDNSRMTGLFEAVVDATEEAIINALLAATTMVGRDGLTAHALPADRLTEILSRRRAKPS